MAAKTQYKTRIVRTLEAHGYHVTEVETNTKDKLVKVTCEDVNGLRHVYDCEMQGTKLFLMTEVACYKVIKEAQPIEVVEPMIILVTDEVLADE